MTKKTTKDITMFRISADYGIDSILHSLSIPFEKQITGDYLIDKGASQGDLFKVMKELGGSFKYDYDTNCYEMEITMPFEIWMKECNKICIQMTSLETSDFEDYNWRGEYDSDCEPSESVTEFLIYIEENW